MVSYKTTGRRDAFSKIIISHEWGERIVEARKRELRLDRLRKPERRYVPDCSIIPYSTKN